MNRKRKYYIYIIVLSIMALLFIGVMIFMIGGKFKAKPFKPNLRESKDLLIDEVYDKNCNEININSDCTNIYVKNSDNKEIRVMIYGNQNKSCKLTPTFRA